MKRIIMAMSAALVALPGYAQTAPAPAEAPVAAPVDPARLAEARLIVVKLLPPGVYRTIMGSTMGVVTGHMADSIGAMPLKQMAEMGGLDAKQAAALDKVDLQRVMAIYDPHWRERMQLTTRALFEEMGEYFTTLEPELREAYARAYAGRFTLTELQDLVRYFGTPTGAKFAANYITVATDPAITGEMQAMMPKLMQQMPTFIAAAQKATASLPPPRTLQQLTPAQRAELAKALGVPESQLHDPAKTP